MVPFPISESSPLRHAAPLPEAADLVVIGGGVVGVCAALFARRRGLSVVLVEKGRVAAEQSSRNWGWIRQQGRDFDELPLMMEANGLWQDLAGQLPCDIGLRRIGVTYLARTDADMARYTAWKDRAVAMGLETRLLSGTEMNTRFAPLSGKGYVGALHTPSDMKAEPWIAVPALADLAAAEGVLIRENCAARGLDIAAGQVAGVVTEDGTLRASQVILAGGAWSSLFLRRHDIALPQLSVRASVAATRPVSLPDLGAFADDTCALRPRADGGFTIAASGFHELFLGPDALRAFPKYLAQLKADPTGTRFLPAAPRGYPDAWTTQRHWLNSDITPFEHMRVLSPKPNLGKLQDAAKAIAALFPDAPAFDIECAWAGMIDTLPDLVPVVDRAPLPGLILGTGLSGHGFGIGPAIGRVLADMVVDAPPGHDLHRFRFARFSDGSSMDLGPAL